VIDATPDNDDPLFCCRTPELETLAIPDNEEVVPAMYVEEAVTVAIPEIDDTG
jgi:hypothetical protein